MEDPVTLTWRELMRWMLVGSDNTAAAVVLEEVGANALARVARDAGMASTRIAPSDEAVREIVEARRLGAQRTGQDRDAQLIDFARKDPILGSVTTARDQTLLMDALWRGRLLPDRLTREVAAMLAQHTVPHCMNRTFCHPGVDVAGKTGSWGPFRHETAVITHTGEVGVAVCVMTASLEFDRTIPAIDDGIGEIAAVLVNAVRAGRSADGLLPVG